MHEEHPMSIHFDNATKTFYLDGKNVTYAFFINNYGYAEHLYFGKRIGHDLLLYTRTTCPGTMKATTPRRLCTGWHFLI